jgi:hypothetical protein
MQPPNNINLIIRCRQTSSVCTIIPHTAIPTQALQFLICNIIPLARSHIALRHFLQPRAGQAAVGQYSVSVKFIFVPKSMVDKHSTPNTTIPCANALLLEQ